MRLLLPLRHSDLSSHLFESAAKVRDPAMMRLVLDELSPALASCERPKLRFALLRPLHEAAVRGHIEHVTMLLQWLNEHPGVHTTILPSLNAATRGDTAWDRCLGLAAVTLHELICRANMDQIDCSLITAVRSGNLPMVELHLNAGANVRHNANEALRLAESQGHAAMVELLKARGSGSI